MISKDIYSKVLIGGLFFILITQSLPSRSDHQEVGVVRADLIVLHITKAEAFGDLDRSDGGTAIPISNPFYRNTEPIEANDEGTILEFKVGSRAAPSGNLPDKWSMHVTEIVDTNPESDFNHEYDMFVFDVNNAGDYSILPFLQLNYEVADVILFTKELESGWLEPDLITISDVTMTFADDYLTLHHKVNYYSPEFGFGYQREETLVYKTETGTLELVIVQYEWLDDDNGVETRHHLIIETEDRFNARTTSASNAPSSTTNQTVQLDDSDEAGIDQSALALVSTFSLILLIRRFKRHL